MSWIITHCKALLFVILFTLPSVGQVSVVANLLDGTGANWRTGYLHFQLENCGDNVPNVNGGNFIVQDAFDLRPASLNGPINGSIVGNDQIYCGNVQSTFYLVTPMKDATRPLRTGIPFVICSSGSTMGTCANGNSLGSFNFNNADPMTSPPPQPGFSLIFANPLNNQTLTQPLNTTFFWYGNVDFSHANVTGLSGGSGSGPSIQVNGVATGNQSVLNFTDDLTTGLHWTNPTGGIIKAAVTGNIQPVTIASPLLTDSGAANAYIVCSANGPAQAASLRFQFTAANSNTGSSTLNYCSNGATAIVTPGGAALTSGAIQANAVVDVELTAGGQWQLMGSVPGGVTSITTDSQTGVTGAFTTAATDYGTKGITQNGTGTLWFQKQTAGTFLLGESVANGHSWFEINPDANGAVGLWLQDSDANQLTSGHALGGAGTGIGTSPGWQLNSRSGIPSGSSWSLNTTDMWLQIPNAGGAANIVLDVNAAAATWNVPVNFAGTGAFQIGGTFGLSGQVPCSTGSAVTWSSSCGATSGVSSVFGTANQIASTGGATPVLSITSPFNPPGDVNVTQAANADDAFVITRQTDTLPTGRLLNLKTAGGISVAQVDVAGNGSFTSLTSTDTTFAGHYTLTQGPDYTASCPANTVCHQAGTSIATSYTVTEPSAGPSAASVKTSTTLSGTGTTESYTPVTGNSAHIQTADATIAGCSTIVVIDGSGNTHCSGVPISGVLRSVQGPSGGAYTNSANNVASTVMTYSNTLPASTTVLVDCSGSFKFTTAVNTPEFGISFTSAPTNLFLNVEIGVNATTGTHTYGRQTTNGTLVSASGNVASTGLYLPVRISGGVTTNAATTFTIQGAQVNNTGSSVLSVDQNGITCSVK